jgi:hypothetical protein
MQYLGVFSERLFFLLKSGFELFLQKALARCTVPVLVFGHN